jgi:glycosyltransferase involved in cell wall biosynthesis
MSRVTVILTSYNHERYLRRAIESVLAQTRAADELIIVDDCSRDGSGEIAREYADRARLLLLEQNVGTYAALNRAIEAATGEWIAILNSDDFWMPRKLEAQVSGLDCDFSFSNGHFVDDNDSPCEYQAFGKKLSGVFTDPPPAGVSCRMIDRLIYHNYCFPSSVLLKRSLWEAAGKFQENLICLGDWDLFLRMARLTKFCYEDSDLVGYRVHDRQTSRNIDQMNMEEVDIRERLILGHEEEYLATADNPASMRKALAHSAAALGTQYHMQGRAGDARRMYLHSLARNPMRWKSLLRFFLACAKSRISSP